MSTTNITAGEVMDWMASLMNDTAKTQYTYLTMLPYLNMALDELQEEMERHNVPVTDETAAYITITAGVTKITAAPDTPDGLPHYPIDMLEIRGLGERMSGGSDSFVPMHRQTFLNVRTSSTSLIDFVWTGQEIRFPGAITDRELKLDYIRELIHSITDEDDIIPFMGAKSYLAYKGAAYCAEYVAENKERADSLEARADSCMDNILGISAKGRQGITTRRRPFRSAWKSRGWI